MVDHKSTRSNKSSLVDNFCSWATNASKSVALGKKEYEWLQWIKKKIILVAVKKWQTSSVCYDDEIS